MAMTELEKYYNKFNEDKRLTHRHGIVEFTTSMKYIKEYLHHLKNPKIIDIGAGTGRYSIELANMGYDVTAVELVKHNLNVIKEKSDKVKAFQGNALNLKRFEDNTFDFTILFGPMYHLFSLDDRLKAIGEAKRVTKANGLIMVAYYMNEYAILIHGFRDNHILESIKKGKVDGQFHTISSEEDLYSMVRLEDIDLINEKANLERLKIFASDGASDYMRPVLNKMSEETFEAYLKYHLSICERKELLGASSHLVDVVKNIK